MLLYENPAIANNVETTGFVLENLAPGFYDITYNIAMKPQESKATYHKAWCWINDLERELIASNITLPQDWLVGAVAPDVVRPRRKSRRKSPSPTPLPFASRHSVVISDALYE